MIRYSDSATLTITAGAVASYVFSANGVYDPNITGTGHQPAGFDQMMLSYEHFICKRSRIAVTFDNTAGSSNPSVGLCCRAGSTPVTVSQQLIEDGLITTQYLYSGGVYGSICQLHESMDIAKFGGVDNLMDQPEYRGTNAANPAEQSYYHVQAWSVQGSTCVVSIDVVIEFDVAFVEPRALTQSFVNHAKFFLVNEETKERKK
jgi:hypothetical protein